MDKYEALDIDQLQQDGAQEAPRGWPEIDPDTYEDERVEADPDARASFEAERQRDLAKAALERIEREWLLPADERDAIAYLVRKATR